MERKEEKKGKDILTQNTEHSLYKIKRLVVVDVVVVVFVVVN